MSHPDPSGTTTSSGGLVRAMGLWDVILFNIAAVLGPRWVASAAHSGANSLSIWVIAALSFFLPSALVIVELSTRYPQSGGLYVWTREAFGPFHGFVSGWTYWIYTIIYFPALLNASVAMAVYLGGERFAWLAHNRVYITLASLAMLALAVAFNLVGVGVGKWLENAGGIGTYLPLLLLVIFGAIFAAHFGSATSFHAPALRIHLNWGTVNYWSQIAFAFSGMELVCTMGEEIRDPQRIFPRAILISGLAIAAIYILGTMGTLAVLKPDAVDIRNGALQALTAAALPFGMAWLAIVAVFIVTIGNVGGVGSTVAGAARVPFAVGIDRYLPRAFGAIHPTWRTPWVAMLVQGVLSAILLVLSQIGETAAGAYQVLVDATTVMYFIPFLYMFLAIIALRKRPDRGSDARQTLVPFGQAGVWFFGLLGFLVTLAAIVLSLIPTADILTPALFELKVIGGCVVLVAVGLLLYWRAQRQGAEARS